MKEQLKSCYEQALFLMADNFLENYHGGAWRKKRVENGFFWILKEKGKFNVSTPGGNTAQEVSAEFAGLVLSFLALHYLLEKIADGGKYELFKGFFVKLDESDFNYILELIESLKDYACDNKDREFANRFFELID